MERAMEASSSDIPWISLLNFDAPRYRECRYILTSPRSLRACENLEIKPIELLPQSLKAFKCSSASQGLHGSLLVAVHSELEKQKQIKLQEARSERERIISEEKKSTATSSVAVKNRGCAAKQSSQESPSHPQLDTSSQHRSASNTPTPSKTALLPEKDQRILRAMVRKGEAMESQIMQQHVAEKGREKKMSGERVQSKQESKYNGHIHTDQETTQLALTKERAIPYSRDSLVQQQKELKKKEQEARLKEINTTQAELCQVLEKSIEDGQTRAAQYREQAHSRKFEDIKHKSSAKKERFRTTKLDAEHHRRLEGEALAVSLTLKDNNAAERLHRQQEIHQQELQLASEKKKMMAAQREKLLTEMENSLHIRQEQAAQCSEQSIAKAQEKQRQLISERVSKLQQKQKERTQQHEEALQRLHLEEEKKKKAVAQVIAAKRQRVEEREQMHRTTAAMRQQTAQLSARLRQTVKNYYAKDSFSKMAEDAAIHASLESKVASNTQ